MKIGILSRKQEIFSTKRLVEAAHALGHEVKVIDPLRCYVDINSLNPMVHYKEHPLNNFDAIIPRIGASITFYGTAIVRQFEMMGVYCVNDSVSISRARDKLRSLQLLSRKGVGLPITGFAHSTEMTQDLIKLVGGAPLVIKLLEGTQGKGVVLAETKKAAASVIDALRGLETFILVQQFIKESDGADIRCFVIGDKVVASMKRQAQDGEFRSNLHQGGKAELITITTKERQMAIKATRMMGLRVSGVDIIRSKKGPLLLEVNSSPGLKGIEQATRKDIAKMVIQYIEKNAPLGNSRRKEKG
ncbi:MAG: 30S ribosomal protein S6--L-glutamate ligase [Deltaproteobacteria bacterium]|nr:30S ribosomal protein S6--L-glutamate ligase [Deltaproteobacteria bacterium]